MTLLDQPSAGVSNRGPAPDPGAPLLEVIAQPLYSAIGLAAAAIPNETRAFQYQIGDTVAGTGGGASTLLHTNMEVSGALATPKVFEVTGMRLVISNLDAASTAGATHPADDSASNPLLLEDVQRLVHGTHLALHVGTKDYAAGPSWLFPGNCGLNGLASITAMDTDTATQAEILAVQGMGKYYSLNPYTVFIPSQQSFHAKLRATQASPPTLISTRLVWVVLDGRLGREAQ